MSVPVEHAVPDTSHTGPASVIEHSETNSTSAPLNLSAATAEKTTTSQNTSPHSYKTAEEESGHVKTVPFAFPDSSAQPAPTADITAEQQQKYEELLQHCKSITEVPVSKERNAASKTLSDSERMFMTKECLLRYLRACKWIVADAKKRIEGTIIWRREWGLYEHTADFIAPENETGKQVLLGFDNNCRPCLYLNPAKQNTERSIRQLQHLTFMLERTLDIAPPGVETLALLIDFKAASSSSNASIGQGKMTMDILQMHYPERLGRALVVNIPWWASLFLKAINPFIDPNTRPKLKFNEAMKHHVPISQLLKEFEGEVDFTYKHEMYWPNLIALAAERRKQMEERWRANGMQIGESEFYLKGGEKSKPLQAPFSEAAIQAPDAQVGHITDEVSKMTVQ